VHDDGRRQAAQESADAREVADPRRESEELRRQGDRAGNSFSQLHTVLGLQWIGIRKHDIDEPYAQFKQISNQKHQALMDAIQKD